MFGLQQGTAVLKEIQKEMSLEAVEKLVGESQDAIAYQKVFLAWPKMRYSVLALTLLL